MILLIDSYDSFSNNLRRLLEVNSGKQVVTIFNDTFSNTEYESALSSWISNFDYIVVGPGPGHPKEDADVGIVGWLFRHFKAHPEECIPILGVCLGFQSMCHEFGCRVSRLGVVKHGQIYEIHPEKSELFGDDLTPFDSVRYHSLHVEHSSLTVDIIPLAVCMEEDSQKVLMAGKHRTLPLYGVQYHPESVCSSQGDSLVKNFDKIANAYNEKFRPGLTDAQSTREMVETNFKMVNSRSVHADNHVPKGSFECNGTSLHIFAKRFIPGEGVLPIDLCDYFAQKNVDFTFLNSAADPGTWSVIGLPITGESEVITHSVEDPKKVVTSLWKSDSLRESLSVTSVWQFLASRMSEKYVSREALETRIGPITSRPFPFFGGYMGVISYEEGKYIETSQMKSVCADPSPDTKLVYVERFVLYDRISKQYFLVSIKDNDTDFCNSLLDEICGVKDLRVNQSSVPKSVKELCRPQDQKIRYEFPSKDIYAEQFEMCQECLHAGDSYELCLTTQSKIHLPNYLKPWDIYKVLAVHKNPSPYSSYMNFDDCILISSSPERFLSWADSPHMPGRKIAELRPIKGTVRNTDSVSLEDATKILRTPKEMGENLMIVDLIRHDLQSFTEDVSVDALMAVEEYKTVYQLVSVIRGHLRQEGYKGIDVLSSSLPPGSMTGAPKKRSIEILQRIESMQPTMMSGGRRGLYSGVAGYWSITDEADWSVTIRSIVNYKKDNENSAETNVWRIGAGGAITVLSEQEGEWEEMHVKLSSTLQTFV